MAIKKVRLDCLYLYAETVQALQVFLLEHGLSTKGIKASLSSNTIPRVAIKNDASDVPAVTRLEYIRDVDSFRKYRKFCTVQTQKPVDWEPETFGFEEDEELDDDYLDPIGFKDDWV